MGVTTLTLALVAALVLNRLDDFFLQQEQTNLETRSVNVAAIVAGSVNVNTRRLTDEGLIVFEPVISTDGSVNPRVAQDLARPEFLELLANQIALADIRVVLGRYERSTDGGAPTVAPAVDGTYTGDLTAQPTQGQAREDLSHSTVSLLENGGGFTYGLEVTLSDPYTFRASSLATVTALLLIVGAIGLAASIVVAAFLASRFATPLHRLTEASRRMAEGDLSRRVSQSEAAAGSAEIGDLSRQFNTMAGRLEESIEIIRRDRDRSREFLADVSHELRTPIAAMRTFNELLQGPAGDDPATRAEFLGSSAQQLSRLDWLAQNLLELSKLDSGLVLLELRPDDLRACVESGAEQVAAAAERRGVHLAIRMPDRPLRVQHDPQRVGQIVSNLVGNAVKFTPAGGTVTVTVEPDQDGARIEVEDTGIGISPEELPHIFERFYRGTGAAEARSTGSGLGLAIVKSIVDMHGGRISVESRPGAGSTFSVVLPRDPRSAGDEAITTPSEPSRTAPEAAPPRRPTSTPEIAKTSSPDAPS